MDIWPQSNVVESLGPSGKYLGRIRVIRKLICRNRAPFLNASISRIDDTIQNKQPYNSGLPSLFEQMYISCHYYVPLI